MINESIDYEKWMGNLYYQIINSFSFGKISNIVELAPGFRSKISFALKKLDYDGTLYIIDSNDKVLNYVKKKYQEIIPKANIITINLDLVDSIKLLPPKIDLFLANHPIDDMLINKYIKTKNIFDNDNNTHEKLCNCWLELDNNKELLDKIINEVYLDFINLFNAIDIKLTVISNYRSWYYLDINNIPEYYASKVFELLKKEFNSLDISNIIDNNTYDYKNFKMIDNPPNVKDTILNKDNWLVGMYKTRDI